MLKTILESYPIATFVIGKDHKILYWNRAMEKLSGIMAEEAVGSKNPWKGFYRENRPVMADLIVDGRQGEIPYWYPGKYNKAKLLEGIYQATDFFPKLEGGGKWLRFTVSALRNPAGTLIGAVETLEDVTDRKLAEDALVESETMYRELSITDALTGLYNSRYFYSQLQAEMERADRYRHPFSLLLLDIDDFKDFNDTYGHVEGDDVLVRLGEVIQRCLRKTDSAYRYGGEEFTVALPETAGDAAIILAERIRKEFADERFYPLGGDTAVRKTVSVGVTQYIFHEELKAFLKRADFNMYHAKDQGKNRVYYHK